MLDEGRGGMWRGGRRHGGVWRRGIYIVEVCL